ncbi:MAG TPA: hypothetical protein VER32_07015 [Pyrinomonadaceae bacterium]|nr:hypothetical protein [Pyrinomonadaceae bacterium]
MSKKNVRRPAAAILTRAALACALLAGLVPAGSAQQGGAKPAAAVHPKTAAIREATAEVLAEASEIRQLKVLRNVESGAQTREEIEQMLVRNLNENTTPEEMRASELALKKFGLAPADFELRSFIIKLLTEQVAGYYDPKKQHFYLAEWIDLDGQKPVMAHELGHALQDQHFNLKRFEDWPKHDSDAELAAHALVEGDATVLMMHYIRRSPLRALAMLKSMATSGPSTEQIDKAPRALRETLVFPYEQGAVWAMHVFERGGWPLISKAYTELPKSTEQIIHPEKYFAKESPVAVAAPPDVSSLLGKGWKLADHDVNGEWGYYLILDEFLKAKDESRRAAAGWGGDRYVLYTGPSASDVMVAHASVWDTEQDAAEFYDAYVKRTALRYPTGRKWTPGEAFAGAAWTTPEGNVLVERRGAHVLVAEGVPDTNAAFEVFKTLWKTPAAVK